MASMALPPYKDSTLRTFVKAVKQPNKTFKPSLRGKTCMITGANSGIGLACAQILPTLGVSHLIIGVRTVSKGEAAVAPIRKAHPDVKIEVWQLDMLSYESIQRFATWCDSLGKLDIAILNAGIGFSMPSKNDAKTGHEETVQVNYLSTTLLSILLLPILARHSQNEPGRLTIVGSGTALFSSFPNINADPILSAFDKPYNGFAEAMEQYGGSKVLVLMLVHTLSQLVPADSVIINTVEPGLTSNTNLHGNSSGGGAIFMNMMKKATAKTPEQAAQTYINAIGVHGRESHGGFLQFFEVESMPKLMHDDEGRRFMERLWKETMEELEFAQPKQVLESVGRQRGILMFNAVSSF